MIKVLHISKISITFESNNNTKHNEKYSSKSHRKFQKNETTRN